MIQRTNLAVTAAICSLAAFVTPCAAQDAKDPLVTGFNEPPSATRPWVWWHWLNGNVSAEGAKLDLEWMKRIGIGGVQLFEGDLATPQLLSKPLPYMTPEWRNALRQSVATAARLGLGFSIATSPGWSATGGPWVRPEAGMKKLVWSDVIVSGTGSRATIQLPLPPSVSGPFQDISVTTNADGGLPNFYRDAAVLAYPDHSKPAWMPRRVLSSVGVVGFTGLADSEYATAVSIPFKSDGKAWLVQDFGRPVAVHSVVAGVPPERGFGAPPPPEALLEASDDGVVFRKVAHLPISRSPVRSASFEAVSARYFRLALAPKAPDGPPPAMAPGAVMPDFPAPPSHYEISEFRLMSQPLVNRFEEKAGFAAAADYYGLDTANGLSSDAIQPDQIIDLTRRMDEDGTLHWTPPPGQWRVVRMGYSLTGHRNGPAPKDATGLEVDKLSALHVGDYLSTYLEKYDEAVGPSLIGKRGIDSLLSDSIEAGAQNWTDDMIGEFQRRRGYSMLPWLPTLTGTIVGDAGRSDRFLWDFRRTIADLIAQNHYGTIAKEAHARGLSYYAEALEDHRPQLGDDMAMRQNADVPMGAMWTIAPGQQAKPTFVADIKGAASVAHIYGKTQVGAESLTALGQPWAFSPRDLKSTIDLEFALGVTRPIIHTSPHQPFVDGHKPGIALAVVLGQYFSRNETWAEQAKGWTDYLARSSFLLSQGRSVADVAYFYGEEAPITGLFGDRGPRDIPSGHDFDFVNADVLLNQLSVQDGDLLTKAGTRYSVLVLGGSSARMTLPVLRRIEALVDAGASVVGPRPIASPSLSDDPVQFTSIVDRLWSAGKILPTAEAGLAARGIEPDWILSSPDAPIALLHRQLDDGEIYFISNRAATDQTLNVDFRVAGKAPQLWRADTAQIEDASFWVRGKRTVVPLMLGPDEALFVVFRQPTATSARTISRPVTKATQNMTGSWNVSFQAELGAPAAIQMPLLRPLNEASDSGVRYFSGTASYTSNATIQKSWFKAKHDIVLDLGEVNDIAELAVNGRTVGQLWKAPYRINVGSYLKPGKNKIEVRVTNLWVNRLIGDAQPGAIPVTFTQGPAYRTDAPLLRSGLVGPVGLSLEVKTDIAP